MSTNLHLLLTKTISKEKVRSKHHNQVWSYPEVHAITLFQVSYSHIASRTLHSQTYQPTIFNMKLSIIIALSALSRPLYASQLRGGESETNTNGDPSSLESEGLFGNDDVIPSIPGVPSIPSIPGIPSIPSINIPGIPSIPVNIPGIPSSGGGAPWSGIGIQIPIVDGDKSTSQICQLAVQALMKLGNEEACDAVCASTVESAAGGPEDPEGDLVAVECGKICDLIFDTAEPNPGQICSQVGF